MQRLKFESVKAVKILQCFDPIYLIALFLFGPAIAFRGTKCLFLSIFFLHQLNQHLDFGKLMVTDFFVVKFECKIC